MRYSLKQLEVFNHVASTLNITNSAEELYMTPPGVHKHIANLESLCEVKLFQTNNRRLQLTEFGKKLYQDIQPILKEVVLLNSNIQALGSTKIHTINLSVTNTFAPVFYRFIHQYTKQNLFSEFRIEAPTWTDQHEHLEKSLHELYIFGEPKISKRDYKIEKLLEFKMVLIAPNNILGETLYNKPEKVVDAQFILPCASGKTRDFQVQQLKKWRVKKPPYFFEGYAAILEAVRAEIGIAFLPNIIVADDIRQKTLIKLPVQFKSSAIPVVAAWKKDSTLSTVANDFLKFLKHNLSKQTL